MICLIIIIVWANAVWMLMRRIPMMIMIFTSFFIIVTAVGIRFAAVRGGARQQDEHKQQTKNQILHKRPFSAAVKRLFFYAIFVFSAESSEADDVASMVSASSSMR